MYSEKFKTFIKMWAEEFAIQKSIDEKVCEDRDGNPIPWYTYPAIEYLSQFDYHDKKILIEQNINGREVECAVLGNEDVKASCVGEIKPADEFYSYDAKYQNENSRTIIPADIDEETSDEIRKLAVKAFKAIDGKGLSRVDFFVEDKTNKVYINEINTLPGFTKISMYPKLFEAVGIPYSALLDKLIETVWDR